MTYTLHLLLWFMCLGLACSSVLGLMAAGMLVIPPHYDPRFNKLVRLGIFIYCLVISWLLARGIQTIHFVLYEPG